MITRRRAVEYTLRSTPLNHALQLLPHLDPASCHRLHPTAGERAIRGRRTIRDPRTEPPGHDRGSERGGRIARPPNPSGVCRPSGRSGPCERWQLLPSVPGWHQSQGPRAGFHQAGEERPDRGCRGDGPPERRLRRGEGRYTRPRLQLRFQYAILLMAHGQQPGHFGPGCHRGREQWRSDDPSI